MFEDHGGALTTEVGILSRPLCFESCSLVPEDSTPGNDPVSVVSPSGKATGHPLSVREEKNRFVSLDITNVLKECLYQCCGQHKTTGFIPVAYLRS